MEREDGCCARVGAGKSVTKKKLTIRIRNGTWFSLRDSIGERR